MLNDEHKKTTDKQVVYLVVYVTHSRNTRNCVNQENSKSKLK